MMKFKEIFFTFLVIFQALQCVEMQQRDKKIVIVGAGLAGISAAAKLIENGYTNIDILEALDRKGGRIYTVNYGDKKIDLGAQWIHGEAGNAIWDMVHNYVSLGSTPFDRIDGVYLLSNGATPNHADCIKLQRLLDNIITKSWSEMNTFSGSFGDFFIDKYHRQLETATYSTIDESLTKMFEFDAFKQVAGFYGCSTWLDLSGKLNGQYSNPEGDQDVTWKDKGFATVFDYITKKLPDPSKYLDVDSKIRYNKDVINIAYNKADENEKIIIKCADGSEYVADNVIVTVSLGVLKAQHSTLFTPPLPSRKVTAIEACGMGTIGKIFLKFNERFWPADSEFVSYMFLWTEEDKQALVGTDKEWLTGIMTFNRVDAFPELLEAFFAGPLMSSFENFSDTKILEDCVWLLEKFLSRKLPAASLVNRTKWLTHDKFRGAYSYISYASETPDPPVGPSDLAEPIEKDESGRPFVHFAGEATNDVYPSYAHGAVLSGYRAAIEAMKISSTA